MVNMMSKESTSHASALKVMMIVCRTLCVLYILIYSQVQTVSIIQYVTFEGETLPVHSSVPVNTKEIIKHNF